LQFVLIVVTHDLFAAISLDYHIYNVLFPQCIVLSKPWQCIPAPKSLQLLVVRITCNDTCIAYCYFNH